MALDLKAFVLGCPRFLTRAAVAQQMSVSRSCQAPWFVPATPSTFLSLVVFQKFLLRAAIVMSRCILLVHLNSFMKLLKVQIRDEIHSNTPSPLPKLMQLKCLSIQPNNQSYAHTPA